MAQKVHISKQNSRMIVLMMMGAFLGSLNQLILGPALPSIMSDLHIDAAAGQWLTTIFLLINGIMIPCTAYLMARFTPRTLFLLAMTTFTAGTLCAGLAHSFFMLLVARVLQALGFGILMPLLSATVLMVVPMSKRGTAMGMVGLVFSVAPAIGPSVAGFIVDSYGWNAVFLALTPLIFLDLVLSFFMMPHEGETHKVELDKISVLYSTIGFGGLLYGFSAVGSYGWTSMHVLVPLVFGTVFVTLFVKRQGRLEEPLLRFDCMRNQHFVVGLIINMVINASLLFGGVLTPIYLQDIRGYSAFTAALIMLPAAILGGALSPIIGSLYDKRGARMLTLSGLVALTLGTLMYVFFDKDSALWFLVISYTVRIAAINVVTMPMNTWSMSDFRGAAVPHANAVLNTLRQIAGSVGTAIFVSLYMIVQTNIGGAAIDASLSGIRIAFLAAAILTAAITVLAYFNVEYKGGKKNKAKA